MLIIKLIYYTFVFSIKLAIAIGKIVLLILFWAVVLIGYFIMWLVCKILKKPTPEPDPNTKPISPNLFKKNPDKMTGLDFEEYCADLLRKKGFKRVYVTPASGDYGADIVAIDKYGEKWVFQCKHYKGNVSNSAVQEVVAAKNHYNAKRAAVMTNSRMTEQARQLAFENAVELYEGLCD